MLPTLLIFHLALASAQGFSKPGPLFDCSNAVFQVIYVACTAGDYTKCCTGGSACCAGGCCDLTSNCINKGTPNEGCCPVSDPTVCGLYPSDSSSSTTAPSAMPGLDVLCEGQNGLSAFYCPPGSTCDSINDRCILPASSGSVAGSSVAGSTSASSQSVASSSIVTVSMPSSTEEPQTVTIMPSSTTEPSTVVVTATSESSSSGPQTVTVMPGTDSSGSAPATVTVSATQSTTSSASTGGASSMHTTSWFHTPCLVLSAVLASSIVFVLVVG